MPTHTETNVLRQHIKLALLREAYRLGALTETQLYTLVQEQQIR